MKQKHYTKREYGLVMKLRKEGLSPRQIIETCKKKHRTPLSRAIEHWIYDEVKPTSVKYPLKNGYEKLTHEKAYVLGVLCGDGCLDNKKPRILLCCTSKEFVEKFIESFKKHYGLNPSIRIIPKEKIKSSRLKTHTIIAKKDQISVTFYGRDVVSDLARYTIFKTNIWRIPKEIMESNNRKTICYFLKGLYDSEGNASYHVSLSSNSLKGLEDAQKLLKFLGIQSTIRKSKTCFNLFIHNQHMKRLFEKHINFRIPYRRKQLQNTMARYKTKKSYSKKEIESLVPKILKLRDSGLSSRKIAKNLGIGKSTVLRKLNKCYQ